MAKNNIHASELSRTKIVLPIVAILGLLIIFFAYLGMRKSRSDSLEMLRRQGIALIESLTLSADNAIKANSFFDLLVQEKFADLVGFLETRQGLEFTSPELADFASGYDVDAILIFDKEMNLQASGARGVFVNLNSIYGVVVPELEQLLADETNSSTFQIIEGNVPGDVSIYYLEESSDGKHVIAIVADALFYSQAKENIGIGYLVRNIAREVGIDYILFQTPEAIVFSSRKIGPVLKIRRDPFLSKALNSDTVMSRHYTIDDSQVFELVEKFDSDEYGVGLFRLGLSMEKYNELVAGFDRQMIALSIVIFAALVFSFLYLNAKQKRTYIDRSFRRMKSLSEKVFDSINSGIIVIGRDKKVEMANHQFLKIFDINNSTIVGEKWNTFSFSHIIPLEGIFKGEKSTGEVESTYTAPSEKKYLLINTGRLLDQSGDVTGIVAVIYDYTHVKELEEASQRKERLSELGDLAAGVAHEIRNPLNAISIAAQRLIGEFEPRENSEEFHQFAGQIRSEAKRLNEIVTRFLAMTRGKTQKTDKINVSKAVSETIRLISLSEKDDNIEIVTEIEPDLTAPIDEDRLKQMAINLIKNAVQACEKYGGKVTVSLKRQGGYINLRVKDTGPGIPEDIRKKIFNPYFTTRKEGTGLGLSIVHRIVDEFKGEIEVQSPPEGGAEFVVTIPA